MASDDCTTLDSVDRALADDDNLEEAGQFVELRAAIASSTLRIVALEWGAVNGRLCCCTRIGLSSLP